MSLQLAAQHLSSQGRGPDSTLVHMSPGEVSSLQQIAMAHGGSLTINPETGLAEAGFLSSILPMIAGAALTATGVGAPIAALMVGGGMTAATGSLKKGIMAGLGAYGGAGLGSGLMAAGSSAAMPAAAGTSALDVLGQPMTSAAQTASQGFGANVSQMGQGISNMASDAGARSAFMNNAGGFGLSGTKGVLASGAAAAAPMLSEMQQAQAQAPAIKPTTPTTPLQFNPGRIGPTPAPDVPEYGNLGQDFGRQQAYFNPSFTPANAVAPVTQMPTMMAGGGPVEQMSSANAVGASMGYPMANIQKDVYTDPFQQPRSQGVISSPQNTGVDAFTGAPRYAAGGVSHLGDYSDGGRLLRGPGDGVSDSIPAMIGRKQPARLADGEFVIPARIVSEIGNGSTEAGARKLYAMMDRIQKNRKKSIGKGRVAVNSRSDKYLPA